MKKYLKVLIVLVALLIIPNVYADIAGKSVLKDDVPNNTYIIGEYMFTRNTNDNYNGQLTVQLIMLAARSINGNNLEDMIIYYKNARGVWINGVSGEQVTPPNSFYILTEDMVEVPSVPHIASAAGGLDTDSFGFSLALDANMKGEVVCREDDGDWEVIGEYNFTHNVGAITETPVNYFEPAGGLEITHEGPYGSLYCKIRTFVENGTSKIYSDYAEFKMINENPDTDDDDWTITGTSAYGTIVSYNGSEQQVIVPSYINGIRIREIASNAFHSNDIESIRITGNDVVIDPQAMLLSNNLNLVKLYLSNTTFNNTQSWLQVLGTDSIELSSSDNGSFVKAFSDRAEGYCTGGLSGYTCRAGVGGYIILENIDGISRINQDWSDCISKNP